MTNFVRSALIGFGFVCFCVVALMVGIILLPIIIALPLVFWIGQSAAPDEALSAFAVIGIGLFAILVNAVYIVWLAEILQLAIGGR